MKFSDNFPVAKYLLKTANYVKEYTIQSWHTQDNVAKICNMQRRK